MCVPGTVKKNWTILKTKKIVTAAVIKCGNEERIVSRCDEMLLLDGIIYWVLVGLYIILHKNVKKKKIKQK